MRTILVGGGSASGKTFLCKRVQEILTPNRVTLISLDNFYQSQGHLSPAEREKNNYDHPDAFDITPLLDAIRALKTGNSAQIPRYDFATHSRVEDQPVTVVSNELLIIEGILTLHWEELRNLADLLVFVSTPSDARLNRRLVRDQQERGRSPESIYEQWATTAEPMYRAYIEPSAQFAGRVIDGSSFFSPDFIQEICNDFLGIATPSS